MSFSQYQSDGFYDEMFDDARPAAARLPAALRPHPQHLGRRSRSAGSGRPTARWSSSASRSTSTATGRAPSGSFRSTSCPRIVCRDEWDMLERGLRQRITALNMFIDDIYHEQRDRPRRRAAGARRGDGRRLSPAVRRPRRRRAASGATSRAPTWCATRDGQFYVLEDNLRCPSGVSYVLQNRQLMKQTFPQLFEMLGDPAGRRLLQPAARRAAVPDGRPRRARRRSRCCRPACYNSAYFEHSFLAQQMGIDLVEGRDLVVSDGFVYMRTTQGLRADRRALPPHRRRLPRPARRSATIRCSACRG